MQVCVAFSVESASKKKGVQGSGFQFFHFGSRRAFLSIFFCAFVSHLTGVGGRGLCAMVRGRVLFNAVAQQFRGSPKARDEPGCDRSGWQHEVASRVEEECRDENLFSRLDDASKAMMRSQGGIGFGMALSACPLHQPSSGKPLAQFGACPFPSACELAPMLPRSAWLCLVTPTRRFATWTPWWCQSRVGRLEEWQPVGDNFKSSAIQVERNPGSCFSAHSSGCVLEVIRLRCMRC